MTSFKRLIVNADDWGQSRGINQGIITSFEEGILTSASLMVRYEAAEEAASYSKNNPSLGVGLHVDLGEWIFKEDDWFPVYEVVSLEDIPAVEEEVSRQLEAFERLMGRKPTHIDSHQHVHLQKHIRPFFSELGQKLNITVRGVSSKVAYCGDFYGQSSNGHAYHEAITVEALKKIISKISSGYTEMACHPGIGNDVTTMYGAEREIEVQTLCNATIKDHLTKEGIQLCSFAQINY